MYVCICNGITERQVKAAVAAGAKRWPDVHRHHGCRAQCGSCGPEIVGYIRASAEEEGADAGSGVLATGVLAPGVLVEA
jgi:bacterioferritin-associated ferredoxin